MGDVVHDDALGCRERARVGRRARDGDVDRNISFDRDFAKFPDLRWRHPLD
jgi:hypothetical protein